MLKYFKAEPTEFVRFTVNGKVVGEGAGLSRIYLPFRTSIELVSVASRDQPFVFNEISSDSQEVALQGGVIYRVEKPALVLARYNFSINPKTRGYLTEDSARLPEFILQLAQAGTRRIVQATALEKLLVMSEELSKAVTAGLLESKALDGLGVGLEMLYFSSIKPKPELARALEAAYRESLLQRADEAIFARRAVAVEKERAIQQNELQTRIEVEERRKRLVELQNANVLAEAEARAGAARKELDAFKGVEPALLTARALYEIGKGAEKIGTLTITPELMASVLNARGRA